MSRRLTSPPQSPAGIAALFAGGQRAPRFDHELAGPLTARI
jgi:hypothetical protein